MPKIGPKLITRRIMSGFLPKNANIFNINFLTLTQRTLHPICHLNSELHSDQRGLGPHPWKRRMNGFLRWGGGGLNINGRARGKWFFDKKLYSWTFTYKEKFSAPSVDDNEDSCTWLSHELLECESAVDALKEILYHINHRYRAGLRQWDAFAACVYIK